MPFQFQDDFSSDFGRQRIQRRVFAATATRIGIDLAIDQFDDVGLAVAGHPSGLAARRRNDLTPNHQKAMFIAGDKALDNHTATLAVGQMISGNHIFARFQVERYAASMITVVRFYHHRQADILCRIPSVFFIVDHAAFRDRYAARLQ